MTHGGGSRRSGTPATKLSRRAVPRPVLHLFPLRPWTSLLQHHLPRNGQPATTAMRQHSPPTKPGRPARSSRPAAGVSASMPATTSPRDGSRDGSRFPFDHFPGIIRMWNIGCNRCCRNPSGTAVRTGGKAALLHLRTHRTLYRSVPTHSTTKVASLMITNEIRAQIRRYFYAEHWKIGTIATELSVHPDAVRNAIESNRFNRTQLLRPCITDPY